MRESELKIHLDCIPCFQRQALQAARFSTSDKTLHKSVLMDIMGVILDLPWDISTGTLAQIIQQRIQLLTRNPDPYSEVKRKYNQLALNLVSNLRGIILESENPLYTSLKVAIAGNIIDFGAPASFDIAKTVTDVLSKPISIDHYSEFVSKLNEAKNILYLADNAGEIVFDKLFLQEIQKVCIDNPLSKITLVVKGAPIINDAMIEDTIQVGMKEIENIDFYTIGNGDKNSGPLRTSKEFLSLLQKYDLVISKGQANFEDLLDQKNIFFLFLVKCHLIEQLVNAPIGSTVLLYSGEE